MYYYRIYGEKVESDIEFLQLVEDFTEDKASIHILQRVTPQAIIDKMKENYTAVGESESWFYNRTLRCVIIDGKYIYYAPFDKANEKYLRTYILGYGLSMLFLQRNRLAMHGSCVKKDGKAIVISGVSGSGKSTLTYKFLSAGYEFMADDITVIDESGDVPVAYPGFPYQKLCRDLVEKNRFNKEDLIYIDEDKDKYLVRWRGQYSTDGCLLKAIVVIEIGDEDSVVEIREAEGFEKLQYIVSNLFLKTAIVLRESNPSLIKLCLDLANKVRIYIIKRPLGLNTVDEQLKIIEKFEEENEHY